MEKRFTLSTKAGAVRLLALFVALIVLCGFGARVLSSAGGAVKISRVTLDARGATIDADLYYPAGTSDENKLPAVLVAHGAGVGNGIIKGYAEELARRGFVVLNVNAYGMGLSESPDSDESGIGAEVYQRLGTPHGMLDALEFIRSLNFVDQTRVGMVGHSLGSIRIAYAAMDDCGYYTLNDRLINILHDTFGQTFTPAEIDQDADALAAERLNADQLAYYEELREACRQEYDTRIRSLCLVGYSPNTNDQLQLQTVTVGGHEVTRNCQVNVGMIAGAYDETHRHFYTDDATKSNWYTGSEDAQLEMWYTLDDVAQASTVVGPFVGTSVADNAALSDAVADRTARVCMLNPETHSKNLFSRDTASDMVRYFEQTLSYNRGDLADPDTVPLDASNILFQWRELLNCAGMIFMACAVIAAAAVLVKGRFFAACVAPDRSGTVHIKHLEYWLFGALSVAIGFFAIWKVNGLFVPSLPYVRFLPFQTWWLTVIFIALLALGSAILLAVFWWRCKKAGNFDSLKALNAGMKVSAILKTILLAVVLLAFAYFTLMLSEYLFNQDYRLWMAAFTEMKVEYWQYIWRYAIIMLPCFLLIGATTNYVIRKDIPAWADTLIAVLMNSAGIWLCCLVNYEIMVRTGNPWNSFISTYQVLLIAPITVYITRKLYRLTNSIWLGAAVNALLISWSLCSANGFDINAFIPQSAMSVFFNV